MGRRGFGIVFLAFFTMALAEAAHANEVIFSYTGGSGTFQGGLNAGNSFNAPNGATFNSLGFIDVGSDGLADSYQVGIWNTNTQVLLASTTVTPSSTLINGFRYASIPQTVIAPGTSFTIGAQLKTTQLDAWVTNPTITDGAGFTGSGAGRFIGTNTSLIFPSNPDLNYAVVNASDTVVPEPTMLCLASIAGMLLLRRSSRI
jgi:hypothetical protein